MSAAKIAVISTVLAAALGPHLLAAVAVLVTAVLSAVLGPHLLAVVAFTAVLTAGVLLFAIATVVLETGCGMVPCGRGRPS